MFKYRFQKVFHVCLSVCVCVCPPFCHMTRRRASACRRSPCDPKVRSHAPWNAQPTPTAIAKADSLRAHANKNSAMTPTDSFLAGFTSLFPGAFATWARADPRRDPCILQFLGDYSSVTRDSRAGVSHGLSRSFPGVEPAATAYQSSILTAYPNRVSVHDFWLSRRTFCVAFLHKICIFYLRALLDTVPGDSCCRKELTPLCGLRDTVPGNTRVYNSKQRV